MLQSTLVEVQQLREQHEAVAESLREAQTPSRSAVEIVDDSQSNYKKQQVDGKRLVVKLMKSSQTSAIQIQTLLYRIGRYLTENGFEIVLVGENRTEEALEKLVDF